MRASFLRGLILSVLPLVSILVSAAPLGAQETGPTPYPDPKDEAAWPGEGPIKVYGWMVDSRKGFWAHRTQDQGAVVFVGDSLTYGWPAAEMSRAAGGKKTANRGIGGDVSRGLLFRFKEDVLDLHPRAMVLLIGTNDLTEKTDPAIIVKNIAAIVGEARGQNAGLPIVLCQLPPRDSAQHPVDPAAVADLNARIAELAGTLPRVEVVDLNAALRGPDGKPDPKYFVEDHLHLVPPAYKVWADLLLPAFRKLGV